MKTWKPVKWDEIKTGDDLQVRVRVDKGDSDWMCIGIVTHIGCLIIKTTRGSFGIERTFERLEEKTLQEAPEEEAPGEIIDAEYDFTEGNTDADANTLVDLEMYNRWDSEGVWRGASKNRVHSPRMPGWTYKKIPESEYPKAPIEDGVYRVRTGTPGNPFEHFLEMKNGEWLYPNGAKRLQSDGVILQKYKEVQNV